MLVSHIKKVKFNSPILVASGTYGYGHEVNDIADVDNLGGIVTKSVTLKPREGNPPPRIAETSSGMLNSIGLANLGVESFCNEKIPYLNELDTNVIINIAGSTFEEYENVLKILEKFPNNNHVGYEINISCPNVKEGGMEFGVMSDMTEKLTSKLRSLTDKLLVMKLSPNVTSIQDIAKAAENGGADAVSAINTVVGMGIDIKTYKPKLYTTMGGLSGPAIKPIAIANVHKIYKEVNIPIIAIGGIANASDVIEFILAGADLVQIGTLNYTNPNIGIEIKNDLINFCEKNKIQKLSDLKGKVKYHE
ncbi:MAG: dihydroorotate dehydrogenase B catalytic subunit [Gammaproteobacteria bacterium]|nr:dihydroorotate dehydrogenase B catalytic subunit [Gammaproteobacteria bacterium]|tara:strand:- start:214 stop:1131 length:918 start_codon:yes stop_codon:yes gene_type:complete